MDTTPARSSHSRSGYCERGCQFPHAHQVIGGGREGEDPPDFENAPVTQLAQQRDGFEPPKYSSIRLRFSLDDVVTSVPSGAGIDGAPAGALGVL